MKKTEKCDEFLPIGVEKLALLEENPELARLYDYIKAHPNVKLQELSVAFKTSTRSLQRQIKRMIDAQQIVHVGSRGENSGYKIIDK